MKTTIRFGLLALLALASLHTLAGERYRVAWSHYTGWEPWGHLPDNWIELALDEFALPKFYTLFGISKVQSASTTAFRSATRTTAT